jgi:secreted trypsin-like serine protease
MDSRVLIFLQLLQISFVISEINLSDYPCYKPTPINYRSARIVGGFDAIKEETPYMSAVTRSGGNIFCGASIISEKFLVLSSHCLCNNQNKIIKPSQIRVFVGVNNVNDIKEFNGNDQAPIEVVISEIITHPEYSCGKKSDSDIGLAVNSILFCFPFISYHSSGNLITF